MQQARALYTQGHVCIERKFSNAFWICYRCLLFPEFMSRLLLCVKTCLIFHTI